jgi:hypothetical protein
MRWFRSVTRVVAIDIELGAGLAYVVGYIMR